MSEYYLVDIKSITSKVPRSEFKVDDIEALAQSILTAGGLLSPLLLKQTGVDSYEVLAGDHEYYAAVRAKEINPRSAEMVNSFIVPDELIDAAIEQFTSLHKTQSSLQAVDSSDAVLPATTSIAEQRLTNLESRIDGALRNIEQAHQRDIESLKHQIKIIQKQIPQKLEPLEIFNTANTVELLQKMAVAGIRGKTAEKLIKGIEKARQKSPFTSFTDVVCRIEGLADKRMLVILDAWGGLY
jgi:predicted nucleic acid-binding OB-fold protein